VRSGDCYDLGQGHALQFLRVPTPRWPDGLWCLDSATQILYSDKFFGVHVCEDALYDDNWKTLDADRHYYFDCLHAPQAKQVEAALESLSSLGVKLYAPGHGPLVRYSLSRFTYDYRQWCQQQRSKELKVALLYASAYGNTATVAQAIGQGLMDSGVTVEAINCEFASPVEISQILESCDGFIIGSPTLGGHAPTQIQTALGLILSTATKGKLAGVFGSYGWSGEAIDLLEGKLRDANFRFGFPPLRIRFSPTEEVLANCATAGREFAQALRDNQRSRVPRQGGSEAQFDRTDQAVGRIVGSVCVVTTLDGSAHKGILTSWVSQASFSPPGLMIALADDQNADLMRQAGAQFVLNVLKEGRNVRRYFARHGSQGDVPYASLTTQIAQNGCLVLGEALAFLECTTQRAMKCGDRWLIYAAVEQGQVLADEGLTAIEHRKSGSQD
jgi:flavin reductase (DIM6/NTAB) family NADH-FMN oxidoreductase RutF/flavodoxin